MANRRPIGRAASWIGDRARNTLLKASSMTSARRPHDQPLRFLFTIDTEISMGGALQDPELTPVGAAQRIWGETNSGRAGIDTFMDVFDEYGMRGVFFYEVCGRNVVEEAALERAAQHIVSRGHDIELHVHPEFRVDMEGYRTGQADKPSALLRDYALQEQVELLSTTADRLERWTGRRPIAFRAGGFGADDRVFEALHAAGLKIDSSYSLWSLALETCQIAAEPRLNDIALMDRGIWEVPVTCYEAAGPRGGLRQFDLASLGVSEAIGVLEDLHANGAWLATSLTHSFRLLKTTDVQYTDARPDETNIHRLRALCRFLAENGDRFQVCTYKDLPLDEWAPALAGPRDPPHLPHPPAWASLARLAVQAVKDRGAL